MKHEKLFHIDLFSGIGGFALAADRVFGNIEHIFCEIDPFCQEVLKKHYPNSKIYGDIREITKESLATDGVGSRHIHGKSEKFTTESEQQTQRESSADIYSPFILTGGFPCQPFSQAGRRKGTEDDRHLWPQMLRVIQLAKPQWVIAENVRGLLTIGGGLVFEQVCTDLESAGYEVQPLIIPAVALNAPHRRDRVWFVASKHSISGDGSRKSAGKRESEVFESANKGSDDVHRNEKRIFGRENSDTSNNETSIIQSISKSMERKRKQQNIKRSNGLRYRKNFGWNKNWLEVATRLCRMDDGLRKRMDRNPRLKALGNAIVPQVAEEIMRAILKS